MAMYDESAPGQPESRTGAFGSGLAQTGQKFMSKVPQGIVQTSVMQNPYRSANGMSAGDAERMLPGMNAPMMSNNGFSTKSYQDSLFMRLQGQTN